MDFLKDVALPQSPEHYQLIIMIAALASIVFLPYLAFVAGSSVLSVWFDLRQSKKGSTYLQRAAHFVFNQVLKNKSTVLFLGILPALSVVLVYAQILQSTNSISVGLSGFGFLFLLTGFVLLYTYRYTFMIGEIFDEYTDTVREVRPNGLQKYRESNLMVNRKSGIYGVAMIVIAAFLYISAYSLAIDRSGWNEIQSIFGVIIYGTAWLRFFMFAALCLGLTGFGSLYLLDESGLSAEEMKSYRMLSIRLTIISLILIPLLILTVIALQPVSTMSSVLYFVTGITGLLLFIAAHFLYSHWTHQKSSALKYGFYTFIAATVIWIANDHIVLSIATKEEAAILALAHENAAEEMRSKLGIMPVSLTGEDIFNTKCSACHLYDQRNVGPAYKDVLPKYGGDKAKIMAFVLNPKKVNPDYPPMPSQGLKPAEADSIVTFLLSKISQDSVKQ